MNYRRANEELGVEGEFSPRLRGVVKLLLLAALLIVLAAIIPIQTTFAQVNPKRNQNQDPADLEAQLVEDAFKLGERSVFLPAPRELLRPLIRARRALQEKDMVKAVTLLGEVLTDTTTEDFLIPNPQVDGVSTSLRLRAQSILGALPTKDRELYRLRYGVQAKQLLEKAITAGDYQIVSEVMTRFYHTDAGYDAAMILGHHHLDQGRPIAAANCFERITNSAEARAIHDPEASVLLATCWMMSDSQDRATQALLQLQSNSPKQTIQFLGKPVRLFDRPEDANAWLLKLIGDSPLKNIGTVNQWVMAGGNPQRNARSGTGFPLLNPRWITPTVNNPDLESAIQKRQRDLIGLGSSPIPSVQPLAVGNTIVMRAFDRMVGVDFETGKRVWVFPPWNFASRLETPQDRLKTRKVSDESITERMWLDSIYGQASSDGKKIFVVPKPGFSPETATNGREQNVEPALARTFNEMMAIDIAREGAFSWEIGGETGLDEPKLAKAFFLGPPLPLGNELYAVCQQDSEIRMVVLDSETGKLKWVQQLGTTETNVKSMNVQADRFRRLAGVTPSFSNGILVCATGTGALVAVDLSTRSLLWGYQYTTPGSKSIQRLSPFNVSKTDALGGLWRDSTILIAEGKVLFTPVDSQDMICVDLKNGHPTWNANGRMSSKTPRRESLFLACVENGKAILVGSQQIRAVDLETGKNRWSLPLQQYGRPSGRGFANRGSYYLPTTKQQLVQLDIESGKVIKSVQTDGVLGNLICHRGEVISHSVDRLASFPQDEPSRKRIESALATGDLTPELMAVKAQIEFQDGNLEDAIDWIRQSFDQSPNLLNEKLLLDLLLQLIEKDYASGIKVASKYEPQLLAQRRFEFLAAKINGMIRNGESNDALSALFQMLEPVEGSSELYNESLTIPNSKHDASLGQSDLAENESSLDREITIRADRWIGSRIDLLYNSDTSVRSAIKEQAEKYAQEFASLQPENRLKALDVFPMTVWPTKTKFKLAAEFSIEGDSQRSIQLLNSVLQSESTADPSIAATATAELAKEYVKQKISSEALPFIDSLESSFSKSKVANFQGDLTTGTQLAQHLRQHITGDLKTDGSMIAKKTAWNKGIVSSKETPVTRDNSIAKPTAVDLKEYDHPKYAQHKFLFYSQTGEIEILDEFGISKHRFVARKSADSVYRSYNSYTKGRISIRNNLAILDIESEVFVFDWLKLNSGKSPLLWGVNARDRQPSHTPVIFSSIWGETSTETPPNGRDIYPVIAGSGLNGVCMLENRQLIGFDSLTGKEIWRRRGFDGFTTLYCNENHVVAWNSGKRLARILSLKDGRLIKSTKIPSEAGVVWTAKGTRFLLATERQIQPATPIKNPLRKTNADKEKKGYDNDPKLKRQLVGLYDLMTDRFVWQKEYAYRTRACRVEGKYLAVLPPQTGDLEFVSIATGKTEFQTPVQLDSLKRNRITGIGVAPFKGKYLVHFKKGVTENRVEIRTRGTGSVEARYLNYADPMWEGYLASVDPTTGQNTWANTVRFDNFQLAHRQPYSCPLYFLVRRLDIDDQLGNSNSHFQFVAIDIETGKLRANSMIDHNYDYEYQIRCLPLQQQIQFDLRNRRMNFKFDNDSDLPPSPIATITNDTSIIFQKTDDVKREKLDAALLELERARSLKKARAAQALLPQKRAEEKRKLEAEKAGK